MLVRIDNSSLVDDLCSHFRRSGFLAVPAGGSMVEIERPDAPSPAQERLEVELHLRVWRAVNPETIADLIA